jgi:predicted ATP-dependent serine protease
MNTMKISPLSTAEANIHRLLTRGWLDDRIHVAVGWDIPEVLESQELREAAIAHFEHPTAVPTYDPSKAKEFKTLISQMRKRHAKEIERARRIDEALGTEGRTTVTLEEVEEAYTMRLHTGSNCIDKVFGTSMKYDDQFRVIGSSSGMARGKINLLGGPEGSGKTRLYTSLVQRMVEFPEVNGGQEIKVLIFNGEMSKEEYKELYMNMARAAGFSPRFLDRVILSNSRNLSEHVDAILEYSPDLVIWDSYNMIHEAKTADGIEDIVFYIKKVIGQQTSAMMICQLNERGQIKGNNLIRYLVDGSFYLAMENDPESELPLPVEGRLSITSAKNRTGKRGEKAIVWHFGGEMRVNE